MFGIRRRNSEQVSKDNNSGHESSEKTQQQPNEKGSNHRSPNSKESEERVLVNIKPGTQKKPWYKNFLIIFFLLIIVFALTAQFFSLQENVDEVDLGEILERIKEDDYERVEVKQQNVRLQPKDEEANDLVTGISSADGFRDQLNKFGIDPAKDEIYYEKPSNIDFVSLLSALSLIILAVLFFYAVFSTRSLTSGGPMMGFGDSKARLFVTGTKQNAKFSDVRGADEAVEEVKEIVSFLKTPQKYIKMGARIPKGVLLVGHPGTGKTLLARAIAGEANVPFFFTSGSEFEEMLVGTGASRVRDLFTKAKKASPAIVFIDEIDSIAKKRGTVFHSGNTEQTLNQILVEMDGFESGTNVIVIAATNRPDVLDPAILRPGRFDRRIFIEYPDINGRKAILEKHSKNKPLAKDVDLYKVAKRTMGYSGADLENALNEAAIIAAKDGRKEVNAKDIEEAATKILMGPVKKRAKSEKQKKITAYHEAGHALASYYTTEGDDVHMISIIPRGYAGGVTMYLPNEDEHELKTATKFNSELVGLYGGRTAEKLIFDTVTTGASSDIQKATEIARDMVKKYGMSSLGYVDLDSDEDKNLYRTNYSEKTAERIDEEVNRILKEAQEKCEEILKTHQDKLDKISEILIEKEVISGEEFYELMKNFDSK